MKMSFQNRFRNWNKILEMNLLDFPNEILFEFCKHMDFESRVSFRKSCKRTNMLLTNPKDTIDEHKIREWRDKMKILIGMNILSNISPNGGDVVLGGPKISNTYKMIRFSIDEKSEFYMTFNYGAIDFAHHYILNGDSKYSITGENTIISDQLYTKYKFENFKNVFEHSEEIGRFLYQIYIMFICEEQKKNKRLVMNTNISKFMKTLMDDPISLRERMSEHFKLSRYISNTMDDGSVSDSIFSRKMEAIAFELREDLNRYFMDGEETERFMSTSE